MNAAAKAIQQKIRVTKISQCVLIHIILMTCHHVTSAKSVNMRSKCFELIQDIESAVTAQLKAILDEDFQRCFRKWQEGWEKCVWDERAS